jgi:opacity protein-like surface antigen
MDSRILSARIAAAAAALALWLVTSPALAQQRWSLEVLPGVVVPTQDLGPVGLKTGFGIEGILGYRLLPHLTGYAGWDWHQFGTDAATVPSGTDIDETGYAFGFRFEHPLGGATGPALRLRAGGTLNHIEAENADGDLIDDSGHGLGWEVGAGMIFRVTDGFHLTPGARFRSLSRRVAIAGPRAAADLRYVALELGGLWSF